MATKINTNYYGLESSWKSNSSWGGDCKNADGQHSFLKLAQNGQLDLENEGHIDYSAVPWGVPRCSLTNHAYPLHLSSGATSSSGGNYYPINDNLDEKNNPLVIVSGSGYDMSYDMGGNSTVNRARQKARVIGRTAIDSNSNLVSTLIADDGGTISETSDYGKSVITYLDYQKCKVVIDNVYLIDSTSTVSAVTTSSGTLKIINFNMLPYQAIEDNWRCIGFTCRFVVNNNLSSADTLHPCFANPHKVPLNICQNYSYGAMETWTQFQRNVIKSVGRPTALNVNTTPEPLEDAQALDSNNSFTWGALTTGFSNSSEKVQNFNDVSYSWEMQARYVKNSSLSWYSKGDGLPKASVKLYSLLKLEENNVENIMAAIKHEVAFLGFPFVESSNYVSENIGSEHVYLPVFNIAHMITTGRYVSGEESLQHSNASWGNIFDDSIPNWDSEYDPDEIPQAVKQRPYIMLYRFDTPQDGFNNHGMFVLTPTKCTITEELNGKYEFSMEHPIDPEGRWQYIRENAIIKAMGQLFTVRVVTQQWKGSSGKIVAKGDHIWYQMGDNWLSVPTNTEEGTGISSNWVSTLVNQARAYLTGATFSGDTHYGFTPYIQSSLQVPPAIGKARWQWVDKGTTPVDFFLGSNGVVAACGGEFHRDNFDFYINERKHGSTDNAFDLRIGKNMSGIKRTIDTSSLVTYVIGHTNYVKNGTTDVRATWGESWVDSTLDDYGIPHHIYREKEFSYNVPVNYWYSLDPPETIVEAMFKEDVHLWFSQNSSPLISYEVNMNDLQNNPDYQMLTNVDSLKVGNYGYIHDPHLGTIDIEITKTTLNAITGETEQVTFGSVRSFVGQPPEHLIIDPETVVTEVYFQVQDSEGAFCFDRNGDMIVEYEGV